MTPSKLTWTTAQHTEELSNNHRVCSTSPQRWPPSTVAVRSLKFRSHRSTSLFFRRLAIPNLSNIMENIGSQRLIIWCTVFYLSIYGIYIAPLSGDYREAFLPRPGRKWRSSVDYKTSWRNQGERERNSWGRPFQINGPHRRDGPILFSCRIKMWYQIVTMRGRVKWSLTRTGFMLFVLCCGGVGAVNAVSNSHHERPITSLGLSWWLFDTTFLHGH